MARLALAPLSEVVIGAAIRVHKALGPGLLESAYDQCLAYELTSRDIRFQHQMALPVNYRGVQIACGYRVDYLIEGRLLVELKASECLQPIHFAQTLTYLRRLGLHRGLIINFNVCRLVDGVKSVVNGKPDDRAEGDHGDTEV